MQTEEKHPLECVEQRPPDANVGDDGGLLIVPSSSDNVVPLQLEKRPTRQWAAWTREEEESFFTALRQVGKNFEKITCRVQSKNKDQVRHYYYRLVRRMNKLLGPGLYLDAKNSKDTNAAMLRWWSLLEKYSCKASKLHLKPRRFKIFLEALEHQLLKDRKKNVKKRSSQGENYSYSSPTAFPNDSKPSGNDARAGKVVLLDSKNTQRAGEGKGSSTRRNSNIGVSRSSNKVESSLAKSTRQRRKSGAVSAAAIKKWEKAAMAGVSLVADAAEHLERTAGGKEADHQEQTGSGPPGEVQPAFCCISKGIAVEKNVQTNVKLKLQLFPIDETTRQALEMDNHNPHLELTLSTRKKISSILDHLDRKWGTSSVASGELMVFPFNIQRENLLQYPRWSRDSVVTAAEVHAMIGSPTVFRLRYGWILSSELQSATTETSSAASRGCHVHENNRKQALMDQVLPPAEGNDKSEKHDSHFTSSHQTSVNPDFPLKRSSTTSTGEATKNANVNHQNNGMESNFAAIMLSIRNQGCDGSALRKRKVENGVDQNVRKTTTLSAGEWADSLTNVSVGDLLTEVSDDMDANCAETPVVGSSQCLEEIPFTCDSFDAAIAAHISSQNKKGFSGFSQHSSSIWDAEETCDAFSFQKRDAPDKQVPSSSMAEASIAGKGMTSTSSASSGSNVQDLHEAAMAEDTAQEDPMDECPPEPHETENSQDFTDLTDIYWPDSLGPLELDVPSCKYHSEDMILSDSLSGLNRLIASSLDAFQNCSFLGLDEKGPSSSAAVVQGGSSFAGKIGVDDNGGAQSLQRTAKDPYATPFGNWRTSTSGMWEGLIVG